MRVVRIATIQEPKPMLFLTWARKASTYIERLTGSIILNVFENYNWENDIFLNLSKGRLTSSTKRNFCSLNQVLPNTSEWSDFLFNNKNKFQLCNLLAYFFTSENIITDKKLFVIKEILYYIKLPNQLRESCLNQCFKLLNPVDYGWKTSKEKSEPNWCEVSTLPPIEDIDQEQNNLDTLSNFSESTDNTSSDSEDENEGLFAYLTQTMKEKRVGNCASSNNTSIICLKFLYPVYVIFKIVP